MVYQSLGLFTVPKEEELVLDNAYCTEACQWSHIHLDSNQLTHTSWYRVLMEITSASNSLADSTPTTFKEEVPWVNGPMPQSRSNQ